MKRLSETLTNTKTAAYVTGSMQIDHIQTAIPDRIKYEPEVVGFPSLEFQDQYYDFALHGINNDTGVATILDFGCGRGDILPKLKQIFSTQLTYDGIDINQLLITAGIEKYPEVDYPGKMWVENFHNFNEEKTWDWVLNLGNFDLTPAGKYSKWESLYQHMERSVRHCNIGTIFIFMNNNDGVEEYQSFPIPNVVEMVCDLGTPFIIDRSETENFYKLILFKHSYKFY